MRNNIRLVWMILLAILSIEALHAQTLQAQLDGDRIRVSAPQLRFLAGRILERLRNGAAVPLTVRLSAAPASGGEAVSQVVARFVLSFDLWEERFSVMEVNSPRRSASHLSLTAAENWCIEYPVLPVPVLAGTRSLVLKLEIHADEPAVEAGSEKSPVLSVAGLIDIFSRKAKEQPLRWSAVSGPFRMADLKPKNGRQMPR